MFKPQSQTIKSESLGMELSSLHLLTHDSFWTLHLYVCYLVGITLIFLINLNVACLPERLQSVVKSDRLLYFYASKICFTISISLILVTQYSIAAMFSQGSYKFLMGYYRAISISYMQFILLFNISICYLSDQKNNKIEYNHSEEVKKTFFNLKYKSLWKIIYSSVMR